MYVDGILVAVPAVELVKAVGEDLGNRLKIKHLGEAKTFLGPLDGAGRPVRNGREAARRWKNLPRVSGRRLCN